MNPTGGSLFTITPGMLKLLHLLLCYNKAYILTVDLYITEMFTRKPTESSELGKALIVRSLNQPSKRNELLVIYLCRSQR